MGKLENYLLWGTGIMISGLGYIKITSDKLYLGSIGLLFGFFLVIMGVVKHGNI